MKKLSLRQKEFIRKGYLVNYNDLLWFLCYGVGGVCFVKYIPLIFSYTESKYQGILEELELVGFIKYIYYEGFKIIVVNSVTYDYMELTEDERISGKRKYKRFKSEEKNFLRSAMVCEFYLKYITKNDISKVIKKVKNKSNLYFLDKNASENFLLNYRKIISNKELTNELDKHIKVINARFKRQSLGYQNLLDTKIKSSYTSNLKNLYDELEEKNIITFAEKKDWEDVYTLSMKDVYLWGMRTSSINNINTTFIHFAMIISDNFKMKTILTNMKKAKKMINNLFPQAKTVVLFELLSTNLSDFDLKTIEIEAKKDNQGLLNDVNECERLGLNFINHTLADYKNIPLPDEYLYSDNVM